ncbi:CCA tRNA nucleotidyltransferase [Soehngenia saccharolytica]|nr:CCA tRNA nucleotidyltransferase [Soehngenia saccharolytica]
MEEKMNIYIPEYVNKILYMLESNGYQAYLVGGCVRDHLIGKKPSDYDVATNATPEEIEKIFSSFKIVDIGKRFGTITVVMEEGQVEVTTFRAEEQYIKGRKPSDVKYISSLIEDLKRRDFTINAIAYNPKTGIIDPFDGVNDLRLKTIRCVGDPNERLKEDYLRILRAVRFATQLGFTIDVRTANACAKFSSKLKDISKERIRDEFIKILLSDKPSYGIRLMKDLGILQVILPEMIPAIGFDQRNPHHDLTVFGHTLEVLDNSPKVLEVRLAALFHDIGKPYTFEVDENGIGHFYGHEKISAEIAKEVLTRLNFSNELIKNTLVLISGHMNYAKELNKKYVKKQLQKIGYENFNNLIELQIADKLSKKGDKDLSYFDAKRRILREIEDEPYSRTHLAINGDDLKALGIVEGPLIGEILDYLLEIVIENPKKNNKGELLDIVKKKYLKK